MVSGEADKACQENPDTRRMKDEGGRMTVPLRVTTTGPGLPSPSAGESDRTGVKGQDLTDQAELGVIPHPSSLILRGHAARKGILGV